MGRKDDEDRLTSLVSAMLQELSYIKGHTSRTSELLATGVSNNVLQVGTFILPPEGQMMFEWGATCGSVEIHNHSTTNPMTVQASTSGTPSTQGIGVSRILGLGSRTVPINSRFLSVYGTAGDAFGLVAYTVMHTGKP